MMAVVANQPSQALPLDFSTGDPSSHMNKKAEALQQNYSLHVTEKIHTCPPIHQCCPFITRRYPRPFFPCEPSPRGSQRWQCEAIFPDDSLSSFLVS
ncbi:hypothetical protein E2C01_022071 [Portunus trituberculatus]|uniref:Uncharacterized protein n=1 Tax=Portunus trituberculatus TaxID=210409 RepID=A0A5B7E521_PORTR|nr:hypothetical protein [Portunus trituberculatus]